MNPDRETENNKKIQDFISTHPSDLPSQIDFVASTRGWFRPDDDSNNYSTLQAYIPGTLDLPTAIQRIATPIEEAYTTANYGHAIHEAEETATRQRALWTESDGKEKAEELWGVPTSPSSLPPTTREKSDFVSAEGALWDLWYSVLHTAKRIPWRDEPSQEHLLAFVKALKQRPDPPLPDPLPHALRKDWIWESGKLWSMPLMLGPSARETWNDAPGCGAGFTTADAAAWGNVNAFVARVTRDRVADFWIYAVWALREALEDVQTNGKQGHEAGSRVQKLDAFVPAAAVWVLVLGKQLWEREEDLRPENKNAGNPGAGGELWVKEKKRLEGKGANEAEFGKARWAFWKRRFGEVGGEEGVSEETKRVARETVELMERIEKGGE